MKLQLYYISSFPIRPSRCWYRIKQFVCGGLTKVFIYLKGPCMVLRTRVVQFSNDSATLVGLNLSNGLYNVDFKGKKSNGVKSHDLGGQFKSPLQEITIPSNPKCRIFVVETAVSHVVPSCYYNMSSMSISLTRNWFSSFCNARPWQWWMASETLFWKMYKPMTPPVQNPHQSVTFYGCIVTWWLLSSHIW